MLCYRAFATRSATRTKYPPEFELGRAEPAAFTAECQQLVVAALAAAQPPQAVRQNAACEESVELVIDAARQLTAGAAAGAGTDACSSPWPGATSGLTLPNRDSSGDPMPWAAGAGCV